MALIEKDKKTKKTTYIRANEDIVERVRKFAKENNYLVTDVANEALVEFLEKNSKK